jgi:aspartate aminotransferase-like enzyme
MKKNTNREIVNLLPGPVEISQEVVAAFRRLPVSHRGDEFMADFQVLKTKLSQFVNAKYAEVITGSGTLANEVIAAQLAQLQGRGLILINGEFGERLLSHAQRIKLDFETVVFPWGQPFSTPEIIKKIAANAPIEWIWTVHCETSTGILNDIDALATICKAHDIKLCVDCISSIATVPVNLKDVYLASGVSGKAFCSFGGLAIVFYNHEVAISPNIARYLDLGYYRAENGIPFTISSCLAYALKAAVESLEQEPNIYEKIAHHSKTIRIELERLDFNIMNDIAVSSPAVITVQLPSYIDSVEFGQFLEDKNCFISYKSGYLIRRNLIQTYVTRNTTTKHIEEFINLVNVCNNSFKECV